MPTKNKPKRFNRHRSTKVARRKRRQAILLRGTSRNRAPRPKKRKTIVETKETTKVKVKTAPEKKEE
jgi:hypothetical protein